MDIFDDGEEVGEVKRRTSRVGQVSFLQNMPSVQGVVEHVVGDHLRGLGRTPALPSHPGPVHLERLDKM